MVRRGLGVRGEERAGGGAGACWGHLFWCVFWFVFCCASVGEGVMALASV